MFGDRSLEAIPNPRLRNLKEKTLKHRFRIVHVPGIRHALSRHPIEPSSHLTLPDDAAQVSPSNPMMPRTLLIAARSQPDGPAVCPVDEDAIGGINSVTWNDIRVATSSDDSMVKLINLIEDGSPDSKADLPTELRPYFQFRDKFNSFDGVVLYNDRILIPRSLRNKILKALHSAHQGISQMSKCVILLAGHDLSNQ